MAPIYHADRDLQRSPPSAGARVARLETAPSTRRKSPLDRSKRPISRNCAILHSLAKNSFATLLVYGNKA
jgi:hypothetical protein